MKLGPEIPNSNIGIINAKPTKSKQKLINNPQKAIQLHPGTIDLANLVSETKNRLDKIELKPNNSRNVHPQLRSQPEYNTDAYYAKMEFLEARAKALAQSPLPMTPTQATIIPPPT